MTPLLALGISLVAALAAWRARGVSGSGAIAAGSVGFLVLWGTGWTGGLVLALFFVPSTAVSRLAARRPGVSDARGEQRDAVQVLANGAAGALGACAGLRQPELGLWILTGALAAAAADTWATSFGAFSPRDPRNLLSGLPVPRGTSGGVSWLGTLAGMAGALLVAAAGALGAGNRALCFAGFLVGTGGMLLDSLLGAAVQARFLCPVCGTATERSRHRCGNRTRLVGGWRWLDNDGVNALATMAAGLAAALLWWLSSRG